MRPEYWLYLGVGYFLYRGYRNYGAVARPIPFDTEAPIAGTPKPGEGTPKSEMNIQPWSPDTSSVPIVQPWREHEVY